MKLAARSRRERARRGMTLLEMTLALVIFGVLGYGLAVIAKIGDRSERRVLEVSAEGRSLRAATTALVDELGATSESTLSIATLADGNHSVRFMQPIEVGGVASWGVYDRLLGTDPDSQNRAGWSLRYTVRNAPGNAGVKQLVRQVLDDTLSVQSESVLVEGLRAGTDAPPGFKVIKKGDVWELSLATVDASDGRAGMEVVFHVRTSN